MVAQGDLFGNGYYNTTKQTGKKLAEREYNARAQEARVLAFFQDGKPHSPSQIWKAYCLQFAPIPITSIRRAISTLTIKRKKLAKTEEQIIGLYNEPEYLWVLK
jgi:hypothetical protein